MYFTDMLMYGPQCLHLSFNIQSGSLSTPVILRNASKSQKLHFSQKAFYTQ